MSLDNDKLQQLPVVLLAIRYEPSLTPKYLCFLSFTLLQHWPDILIICHFRTCLMRQFVSQHM
jgi:hypothetical protein